MKCERGRVMAHNDEGESRKICRTYGAKNFCGQGTQRLRTGLTYAAPTALRFFGRMDLKWRADRVGDGLECVKAEAELSFGGLRASRTPKLAGGGGGYGYA
jgi:hypothetical protein